MLPSVEFVYNFAGAASADSLARSTAGWLAAGVDFVCSGLGSLEVFWREAEMLLVMKSNLSISIAMICDLAISSIRLMRCKGKSLAKRKCRWAAE